MTPMDLLGRVFAIVLVASCTACVVAGATLLIRAAF